MKNESGVVLVVALMMLVVLSLLGVMATQTASVEIMIARNDYYAKKAFYHAEGGLYASYMKLRELEKTGEVKDEAGSDGLGFNRNFTEEDVGVPFDFNAELKSVGIDSVTNKPIIMITSTGWSHSRDNPASGIAVVEAEFRVKDLITFRLNTPLYVDGHLEGNGTPNAALGEWGACNIDCDVADYDIVSTQDIVRDTETTDGNWQGETDISWCGKSETDDFLAPNIGDPNVTELRTTFDETFDNLMKYSEPLIPENNLYIPGSVENFGIYHYVGEELRIQNVIVGWGILLIDADFVIGGNIEWHGIIMSKGTNTFNGGAGPGNAIYGAFLGAGNTTVNGRPQFYFDCSILGALIGEYNNYHMVLWRQL